MRQDHLSASLSVRERAFLSMTADVMFQTLGDSFQIHTRRAMGGGGADKDTVRELVCYLAQFGVTRAWTALQAMNIFLHDVA